MVFTEGKAAALGIGFGVAGHVMFVWRGRMSKCSNLVARGVPPPVIDKVKTVKKVVRISVPIVVMRLQDICDEMTGRRF